MRKTDPIAPPRPQTWLVAWECPVCKVRTSAWLTRYADTRRVCRSPYGPPVPRGQKRMMFGEGDACGEIMNVIADERPTG
jgi:hypothetical protein